MENFRDDFVILNNNFAYLDNAATSLTPDCVVEKMNEYYKEYNANIHRGVHDLTITASDKYEHAHKTVADFIGCNKDNIILTKNSTEALNMVAKGKEWKTAVITDIEHHSNFLPWMHVKNLRIFELEKDFSVNLEKFSDICRNADIVSFTHVSNVLGNIMPVDDMVKIAKENNALVCLDGAQSVPHLNINIKKTDIDFLAFSGHKMLGPTGTGILYVKNTDSIKPLMLGGGTIEQIDKLAKSPEKFEAGTPNIAGMIGLGEAIKYLNKVGMNNIEKHEKKLVKIIFEELLEKKWFDYFGSDEIKNKTGVISFNIKNVDAHTTAQILNENKIFVRSGHHCCIPLMKKIGVNGTVRASFYFYNTEEEISKLIEILKKIAIMS